MNATRRLKTARKVRHQAAHQFHLLETGQLSLHNVLETPPRALGRVRVFDVLRRAPKLGEAGAEKVLRHAKVWPLTRLDNLSPAERQRVIECLPPRANRAA